MDKGIDLANLAQAIVSAVIKHNPAVKEMIVGIHDICKIPTIKEQMTKIDQIITNKVNGGMHKSKILNSKSNLFCKKACLMSKFNQQFI